MSLPEGYLNINPTTIAKGQLVIADNSALTTETDSGSSVFIDEGKSGNGEISVYIVRKGDTVSSVAKMFDVSPNTVRWANDISGSTLKVGDQLVILPVSGVRHIVKSGDTIASIAKKYKASQSDILAYNDMSAKDKLSVVDEIIIPDGEIGAPSSKGAGSVQKEITNGYKEYAGYYMRPIVGGRKTQGLHGHNGVDLGAPTGTSVMAAAEGTVLLARSGGYNGGYGSYIVIKHKNGTQTLYAHLSRVSVSSGQSVNQGQMIGAVGNTGRSTGPHLHFEVRGARNPF